MYHKFTDVDDADDDDDNNNNNKLCAWRHNMPPPLQVDNIFAFICQVAPVPACGLFKTSATSFPLTF